MALAYFGLVLTFVTVTRINNEAVKRDAARTAAVNRCIASRPNLAKISRHLGGVNDLAKLIVANRKTEVLRTPPGDPRRQVSLENLRRSKEALKKIAAIDRLKVPSLTECQALNP
jgi:hypothetical protein